jgi:hypothetical protein
MRRTDTVYPESFMVQSFRWWVELGEGEGTAFVDGLVEDSWRGPRRTFMLSAQYKSDLQSIYFATC